MNRTNDQGPQWDSWDNEKDVPPRRGEPSGGVTHYEGVDMASVDEADAREALVEHLAEAMLSGIRRYMGLPDADVVWNFSLVKAASIQAEEIAPLVSAIRAEVERSHWAEGKAWEMVTAAESRAESAEADLRALREGLEALADDWDKFTDADWFDHTPREHADVLRALLAPSPAEGAVRHDVD